MSIRSFYYLFLLSRISSPLSAVNPPPIIASPQTAALQLSGLPIATHRCSSPTPRLIFSRSLDLPICLLCVFLDGCLVQRLSTVDQVTLLQWNSYPAPNSFLSLQPLASQRGPFCL